MTHDSTSGRPTSGTQRLLGVREKQNLHNAGGVSRTALQDTPELAIGVYELELKNATSPLVADRLQAVFEPHIDYARKGARIVDGAAALPEIATSYHDARRSDRRTLVKAAVQALLRLGL